MGELTSAPRLRLSASPYNGQEEGGVGSPTQNLSGKLARAERKPTQQCTYTSPARSSSAGATQAGATQGPQNPVHLARLCTHHLAQDNVLSPGTAKPVKAVWSLLPCQVKNRRILWPHTHCTDGETESTGDIPLFQGSAVDTGARIGTSRKTIARFINLGQYHCRYSFETLKMCWL